MKLKLAIAVIVGFAAGFGVRTMMPPETTVADHWRIVEEYRNHVFNPENYTADPQTGLSSTEPPHDIEPSLAALVSADELRHLDLVLPSVAYSNRNATRHWMAFCDRHKEEIVWSYGNPSSAAFPTQGGQPLHLHLWFPESSTPLVQQLISELEGMGDEPINRSTAKKQSAGCSTDKIEEIQPLIVQAPADWTVNYQDGEGIHFYTLTCKRGENSLLMFSRWPAPGSKKQIPALVDSLAKGFLKEVGKSEEIKLDTLEYDTKPIMGDNFSGHSIAFMLEGGSLQTMFMISDGKGIWNGQFTGSKECWIEAIEILKKLRRSR